jgi:hypothetical protein
VAILEVMESMFSLITVLLLIATNGITGAQKGTIIPIQGQKGIKIFGVGSNNMKIKINKFLLLLALFGMFFMAVSTFAHPGRTDKRGCHYCRTNCKKWGLRYGQYHCHRY